jgi:hypothetical protein
MTDMFNWIVNQNGKAFVKSGSDNVPVFGVINPTGQPYLRALNNGAWTDDLLNLPVFTE